MIGAVLLRSSATLYNTLPSLFENYTDSSIMKFLSLCCTLIITLCLFGCTPSSFVIMPDYKGKELHTTSLMIAPVKPHILNKDDVTDDLGPGDPDSVFQRYFESAFGRHLETSPSIRRVDFAERLPSIATAKRTLPLNRTMKLYLNLPTDGTRITFDSLSPEYVLFINDINISRTAGSPGVMTPGFNGMPGGFTGGSAGTLRQQFDFALWDNLNGSLVSYGSAETNSSIAFFKMTKENWNSCLRDLSKTVIRSTPFAARSSSSRSDTAGPEESSQESEQLNPVLFKIKAGGEFVFHLRDKDAENPNIPDQFENLSERPSIAYFFDDGSGYHGDAAVSFSLGEETTVRLVAGISYDRTVSRNQYHNNTEKLFGEELTMEYVTPYFGAESSLELENVWLYGHIGPTFRSIQGTYEQGAVSWKSHYSAPESFRFSFGVEHHNFIVDRMLLGAGINIDIGSIEIISVEASQSGQQILTGQVTGNRTLSSGAVQLQLSLGYHF